MADRTSLITLLTDFGLSDSYVAEVKGVLLTRAPRATLVDISHQVPPGDVRAGQYLLSRAWRQFPKGTVHLAIVDPGVGTSRRTDAHPRRRRGLGATCRRPGPQSPGARCP
ncbi:MAG TPA: SAM-dependent chlorinase/fluorinase, partial [Gemmatimonadales bacterium]|nr:SAM-dependent chlorinase/fluorinase [Gemmatimonadales bacterium]